MQISHGWDKRDALARSAPACDALAQRRQRLDNLQ
jgi:hypothetical protein